MYARIVDNDDGGGGGRMEGTVVFPNKMPWEKGEGERGDF